MKKGILKASLAAATLSGVTCALAVQDINLNLLNSNSQNDLQFDEQFELSAQISNNVYEELLDNLNEESDNQNFESLERDVFYFSGQGFEETYVSGEYAVKTARENEQQPRPEYSAEVNAGGQHGHIGGGHQGYPAGGDNQGYPAGTQHGWGGTGEHQGYPSGGHHGHGGGGYQGQHGEQGYFVQYVPAESANEQAFLPANPQNGVGSNYPGYMPNYSFDMSQIAYPGDGLEGDKIWQLNSRNGLEISFSYGDPTDKRERKRQKSRPKMRYQKLKQLKETIDQVKSGELEPQISMNITVTAGNYEYAFFWDYGPVMIGQMTIWYDLNGDIFELPVPVSEEFWGKGTARYAEARFCPIEIPVRAKIIGIEARVWEGTMSVGPGGPMGTLPMSHDADERQYVLWGEIPVLSSTPAPEEDVVEPDDEMNEEDESVTLDKPVPVPASQAREQSRPTARARGTQRNSRGGEGVVDDRAIIPVGI